MLDEEGITCWFEDKVLHERLRRIIISLERYNMLFNQLFKLNHEYFSKMCYLAPRVPRKRLQYLQGGN